MFNFKQFSQSKDGKLKSDKKLLFDKTSESKNENLKSLTEH